VRRVLLLFALVCGCSELPQYNAPAPTECTPDCGTRTCGADGCGGSCGACALGEVCGVTGACLPACTPDCTTMTCGDDGCGGSCGACSAPTPFCSPEGRCVDCLPDCEGRFCGDDGCGGSCGMCDAPLQCDANGQCLCVADCTGRECGFSCDTQCGPDCDPGEICNEMGMCEVCTPDCTGRVCGDDGCGGSCGDCPAENRCNAMGMCEDCMCDGAECSDDGCCGFCPANANAQLICSPAGLCSCEPDCQPQCDGRACGPDGCGGVCGAACATTERCTYDRNGATAVDCRSFTASPDMTFFVSSVGNVIEAGNFGGLVGADAFCQGLADAAGVGNKTWVAYLSITGTAARDRIGLGPWNDAAGDPIVFCNKGQDCVQLLHDNNVLFENVRTERGDTIDVVNANTVFTGSDANGNPTGVDCQAWTTSDENEMGSAGSANAGAMGGQGRWNSGQSVGCDWTSAACAAGRAHLYCFSPD
jgi:hypothetical protein